MKPDLCVIGTGAGGVTVASAAALMGVPVVVVAPPSAPPPRQDWLAVVEAGERAALMADAHALGLRTASPRHDLDAVLDRAAARLAPLLAEAAPRRLRALGATVIEEEARFIDRRTLAVGGLLVRPRRVLVALPAVPTVPDIPGLAELPWATPGDLALLRGGGESLIVLGGGAEAVALAQAVHRLGRAVTLVPLGPLLPGVDPELVMLREHALRRAGLAIAEGAVAAAEPTADGLRLAMADGTIVSGGQMLLATPALAPLEPLDPAAAGLTIAEGRLVVDGQLHTTNRRVLALGAAIGTPESVEAAEAGLALRQLLFRLPVDRRRLAPLTVVPGTPEIASVGLGEAAARAAEGDRLRVYRWPFGENARARAMGEAAGVLKVMVGRGGTVLGAAAVGPRAAEAVAPFALAAARRLPVEAVATLPVDGLAVAEVARRAAGQAVLAGLRRPWLRGLARLLRRLG